MTQIVQASATTTPGSGDLTFAAIKNRIARYYGLDKDPERVEWIGSVFHSIIDELNTKKLWNFNLIESSDITTTSGTAEYSVPSDLWRLYSVRKEDAVDYLTTTVRQRDFDLLFQGQLGITGYPYVNVVFNLFRDGTIKLFPTPDSSYTIKVRYFKLIAKPTDGEMLDLPRPYQVVPEYGTLARVAMMLDQNPSYWEGKYQEVYGDMQRSDEDIGDEDMRFKNVEEFDTRIGSFLNPAARPRFLDFY